MGNISLSEGALLDVSADAAGTVRIRGGQLVMDEATISADTGKPMGPHPAIDIDVTGDLSISPHKLLLSRQRLPAPVMRARFG